MSYYWQGGQRGCLASDAQFNRVSETCAREAFLALTPGLRAYVEDARDWAGMFFAFASSDDQLNDQAFAMSLDPGASNLTNRYCMILNALDSRNRRLDARLWGLVRDKLLCSVSGGSIKGDGEVSHVRVRREAWVDGADGLVARHLCFCSPSSRNSSSR